jgi:glycosyl transferase family 2
VNKAALWNGAKRVTRAIGRTVAQHQGHQECRGKAFQHRKELKLVQDNLRSIRAQDVILVTCLRNELVRLPFFLTYYRDLGVDHFLIIDNGSTDGFMDWVRPFEDCSVWHTEASYLASNFGMHWCNHVLSRYGKGHLCLTVDPDEYLVYPHMKTRNLQDLGVYLRDDERESMHVLMLDAYGKGALSETVYATGDNPFEICPYFDRDGYIQRPGINASTWIQGGPRMRVFSRETPELAPALNKMPLIWWKPEFCYRSSMHDGYPVSLNRAHIPGEVSLTGGLFHFKLLSLLIDKATEEIERKQHYAGSREYRSYLGSEQIRFYETGLSVKYESPEQLIELGLMSAGSWI